MKRELSLFQLKRAMFYTLLSLLLTLYFLTGCARLLGPGATVQDVKEIITNTNMRGCIYVRGSTLLTSAATLMMIGTWGQDPPPYRDCFTGLPVSPP